MEYASMTQGTGYKTQNEAVATALAGAAAMKEANPNVKITVAVGPRQAIGQMKTVSLEDKGNS